MKQYTRYFFIGFLFFLLIAVRAIAPKIFYDPLINYFTDEYLHILPEGIETGKLFLNLFFRYVLNAFISLGIICLIFKRIDFVKFAVGFYVFAFITLSIIFYFLLKNNFENGHLLPFYIRRFLIHPLILLVLLPAFYYQTLQEKEV